MDGVVEEVVSLVGARVSGDDLSPAADHHCVDVAPYQDAPISVGRRHRVVVGPVPDQGQRTHPARLLVAGVVCHRRLGRASMSRSIR